MKTFTDDDMMYMDNPLHDCEVGSEVFASDFETDDCPVAKSKEFPWGEY